MKQALKVLALGVVFAASTTLAKADTITTNPPSTISVNGANFQFNTNTATVTFAPNGTGKGLGNYTVGGATGTFATYFSAPNPVTFFPNAGSGPFVFPLGPMTSHMPPSGPIEILTTTENGETLTFTLTSESWSYGTDPTGNYTNLSVTGTGIFNLTGATNYTPENASFNFTSQQTVGGTTELVSFSGTGTALGPVPEPSSLALLGTGLLGAAAIARRRFAGRFSA